MLQASLIPDTIVELLWVSHFRFSPGSGGTVTPPLDPPEVVKGMLRVVDGLTAEASGSFVSWEGEAVPW